MTSPDEMFGWDMLFKTVESKITCEADVIMALAHWFLVKNHRFRCLGLGDEMTAKSGERGNELLPDDWNAGEAAYAIRYIVHEDVYVLLGTITQDSIIINLLTKLGQNVSAVTFHLKNTVKALKGQIETMVPDVQLLLDRFRKELVPIIATASKTAETQTVSDRPVPNPIQSLPDPLAYPPRNRGNIPQRGYDPLRDIGRGDLDPFGQGGGMLFNPPDMHFRPPARFPDDRRPNIPPNARFDPFGPVGPNNRMGPDNDHFRPPGNYDDMFM